MATTRKWKELEYRIDGKRVGYASICCGRIESGQQLADDDPDLQQWLDILRTFICAELSQQSARENSRQEIETQIMELKARLMELEFENKRGELKNRVPDCPNPPAPPKKRETNDE